MTTLAPTIEAWFTERLLTQRQASPRTVAAYRDTWRMLLAFAQERTGKTPSQLDVGDVDVSLVGAFLTHLEAERHNSARTRNTRARDLGRSRHGTARGTDSTSELGV